MGNENLNIVVKLQDEASAKLEALQGHFKKLNKDMGPAIDASNKFAIGLTAVATAALGFGVMAVKAAGDMQALTKGMIAVSGSSEEAEKNIKNLKEVAKLPGLGFREAIQGSINLQAAGLSAEKSQRALKAFGNALATVGKGRAELDGVVLALQQISSKGIVSAEEINQLNERLPQIRKAMKDAFGTADTEALKKMGIRSDVFIEEIIKQFEKLPPVANSFNNSVENLRDAWDQFLMGQGAKLLDWAQKFIDLATNIVTNVLPKWIAQIEAIVKFLGENKEVLYVVAGAIMGALIPAIWAAVTAFAALTLSLAPYMLAGAAIGGLIIGIKKGSEVLAGMSATILTLVIPSLLGLEIALWPLALGALVIGAVVAGVLWIIKHWDYLVQSAKDTMTLIGIYWDKMWKGFDTIVDTIWTSIKNSITSSVNWILEKVNTVINAMNSVSSFGAGMFGGTGKSMQVSTIPMFAEGGIVNSPTIGMIGEAGPEAIIPLSQMGNIGGGTTVIINNPEFRSRDDEDRLRRMLDQYFRPLLINNKI